MSSKLIGALKSKTVWLGTIVSVLPQILQILPELRSFLGENYAVASFVLGTTIIVLRAVTDTALKDK